MQAVADRHNSYFQGLSNGTNISGMSRIRHQCAKPCGTIKLVYANYYLNGSYADTNGPNSITVKASVEYPAGTFFPVTFNGGSTSAVLAAGDILVSDPISGLSVATAGDFLYSRTYVTVSSGQKWPIGMVTRNTTKGEGYELDGIDKTASGTVTASTSFSYSPSLVIGVPTTAVSAIAIVGDSIGQGNNDTSSPTAFEERGMFWRAFGSAATYATVNGSQNGGTLAQVVAASAMVKRLQIYDYCTHAICELAVNDLSGGISLATLQTNLTTLWTSLANLGLKVYQTTVTPRDTTTDSYATTANQTVYTAQFGTDRAALNDWIRTTPSPLSGYIEIADAVESARNSNKWIVTGAANYATADGLHPSAAAHALAAAAISLSQLAPATTPTNLAASAVSSARIDLTWTQVNPLASANESITLEYGTASDFTGATSVTGIDLSATSYSVTGLAAGTLYYFRIMVESVAGADSDWSSSANATTNAAGRQTGLMGISMGLGL